MGVAGSIIGRTDFEISFSGTGPVPGFPAGQADGYGTGQEKDRPVSWVKGKSLISFSQDAGSPLPGCIFCVIHI
jgi:hypothetical protein